MLLPRLYVVFKIQPVDYILFYQTKWCTHNLFIENKKCANQFFYGNLSLFTWLVTVYKLCLMIHSLKPQFVTQLNQKNVVSVLLSTSFNKFSFYLYIYAFTQLWLNRRKYVWDTLEVIQLTQLSCSTTLYRSLFSCMNWQKT